MGNVTDADTARDCIRQIRPDMLDYDNWLAVGMACKDAGVSFDEWDAWSRTDGRYRGAEMRKKWDSFRGSSSPVKLGTLVKLCIDGGGRPPATHTPTEGRALDWDDVIGGRDELQVVRQEWVQDDPIPEEPADGWNGIDDLCRYLRAVFASEDLVGYVTESWESEPDAEGHKKNLPRKGVWDRTAGELLELLSKAKDLGEVVGDWKEDAGAWIRFNPLDGQGCRDENVTAFRYALVESDSLPIERQHAIYRQLDLPIAAMVHSGGKSLHAIVRVDAPDFREYQKRVDFLYDVCKRNGLQIDRQNRNPSRLSRMPGATRNGRRQWLVATNCGKATWAEWEDWISAVNDDLPDVECLADIWGNLPPLADSLIEGVLRAGHKMLLTGPSKAGKSFLLLQLAIAIAEGRQWVGWDCRKGRVLYVNLELDRPSVLHRLRDVYQILGYDETNIGSIDIWNLRGKALPMTELAPKLIRRACKRRYTAVIIDPIYKVITGDENAADQMAKFCNQFDRVCHELGAAVIYCHHHSKGDQGQKKAHDRASGSGVFARDPDALLDLIELNLDEARRKLISNRWQCAALSSLLDCHKTDWREDCPQDDAVVADKLAQYAIQAAGRDLVAGALAPAIAAAETATGWRVEGILREYQGFKPRRLFFRYPVHLMDDESLLVDAKADGEEPPWMEDRTKREAARKAKADESWIEIEEAVAACGGPGVATVKGVAESIGCEEDTVRNRIRKCYKRSRIRYEKGLIVEKTEKPTED